MWTIILLIVRICGPVRNIVPIAHLKLPTTFGSKRRSVPPSFLPSFFENQVQFHAHTNIIGTPPPREWRLCRYYEQLYNKWEKKSGHLNYTYNLQCSFFWKVLLYLQQVHKAHYTKDWKPEQKSWQSGFRFGFQCVPNMFPLSSPNGFPICFL